MREIDKPEMTVISEAVSGVEVDGMQVELGGDAVFLKAEDDTGHIGIGLLIALLVLVVVFGTLVSAVVPIGLALVAVGAGIGGITLLAGSMDVSASAIPVAGLIGLGVGVDYALFIVARYRENRGSGQDNRAALASAMSTSGSAVVFAGGTVVIATAALALTGLGVLTSIGLATAMMVFFAVAAATTLLPAVLSLLGDKIDKGKVVRRHRPAKRAEDTAWWRFGHHVSGRPWPYLLGSVFALLAIAAPALWMQTAFPAAGDAPAETTHRQAYDLLAEGFGTGFNGPLLVVVDLNDEGVAADGIDTLTADIDAAPADRLGQRAAGLGGRRHRGLQGDAHHRPGRPRHLAGHRPGARAASPATSTSRASPPSPTTSTPSSGRSCRCSSASWSRSRSCC